MGHGRPAPGVCLLTLPPARGGVLRPAPPDEGDALASNDEHLYRGDPPSPPPYGPPAQYGPPVQYAPPPGYGAPPGYGPPSGYPPPGYGYALAYHRPTNTVAI